MSCDSAEHPKDAETMDIAIARSVSFEGGRTLQEQPDGLNQTVQEEKQ
jgi:hypothetical protein